MHRAFVCDLIYLKLGCYKDKIFYVSLMAPKKQKPLQQLRKTQEEKTIKPQKKTAKIEGNSFKWQQIN